MSVRALRDFQQLLSTLFNHCHYTSKSIWQSSGASFMLCCIINMTVDRKGQNCALRYPSHLSQPKCLTSLTWLRSPVLTRQSWRRRRRKKKTLCPPKRVSAPHVCVFLKDAEALIPLQQFSCQLLLITPSAAKNSTCSASRAAKKNAARSAPHWYTANQKTASTRIFIKLEPADQHYPLLSFFSAIEQERKGDATPWLLSTWRKEAEMPQQKALSFDYHSILILYFVFRNGCSWAPWGAIRVYGILTQGVLLPLGWTNFSLGACLLVLAYS